MKYHEPMSDHVSPIKPNKPVLDLSTGILYMNGNTMKDLALHVKDSDVEIIIEEKEKKDNES